LLLCGVWQLSVDVSRKVYGDNNTHVANALHELGTVLEQQGHHDDAKAKFEEALKIREQAYM
jgi:hypothetical protein